MHTALRNSRFPRCLTIHPDQQRFQSGLSGALGFTATMAPPSPCALQRLGDPLVTQETRCVRRSPLRHFPTPCGLVLVGVLYEHGECLYSTRRRHRFLFRLWARELPPWLGFKQSALTIYTLPDRPLTCGTQVSPAFSHHAIVPSPFRVQVRCWINNVTPVVPLSSGSVSCASQGAPPCIEHYLDHLSTTKTPWSWAFWLLDHPVFVRIRRNRMGRCPFVPSHTHCVPFIRERVTHPRRGGASSDDIASDMLRWADLNATQNLGSTNTVSPYIQDLRIRLPYMSSGFSALQACCCPRRVSPQS